MALKSTIIEIQDLHKRYNGALAVSGVSLNVYEGEVFGFLGPNGAGKTTTISILCTLLNFDSGSAFVNGFDCKREPGKVRQSIGLVFQEVTLDNELTAYENLKFHCYMYNMGKKLAEERIDEMLVVVGLSDRKQEIVKKFSGGMKRRLEIARGLLHRPKVLFLDEPTLGLDPQTRTNVWEFIRTVKRSTGSTVFMTTHYMDEAEVCDRVAIIDKGRIIACDTPSTLKSSLKGDTIHLKTEDDEAAMKEIFERFGLKAAMTEAGLFIIVDNGEKFIPRLFERSKTGILSISLKRPSLEDVFLNLTGKKIREGNGHGKGIVSRHGGA
ncbi:MAG: ATP-binding cassette domain-containing protein [Deltaproteobacteria bacterium]|nr:ATP-binding cassette domain-containing protein [Deltaproteobacteria bacterium]